MKKIILISLLLCGIILGGCSNNKKEIKLLKEQNALLEKQVDKRKNEDDLLEKQIECKNICEKIYKEDITSTVNSIIKDSVLDPEYTYNKEKNTCFYNGGLLIIGENNKYSISKRITNCITNKKVLSLFMVDNKVYNDDCANCANSVEEYNIKKQEFMGQ